MAVQYDDNEIAGMIGVTKQLPLDCKARMRLKPKRGHLEREMDIDGSDGNKYRIVLRQNSVNPLDFSVILALHPAEAGKPFRLLRYNGKSHEHTNKIEGNRFFDFHIHKATSRYQELGAREDSYAEPSDSFWDLDSAFKAMMQAAGLVETGTQQPELF